MAGHVRSSKKWARKQPNHAGSGAKKEVSRAFRGCVEIASAARSQPSCNQARGGKGERKRERELEGEQKSERASEQAS
eukprot:5634189-Pleurochrysis_carterae.AAC.1